MCVDGGGHVLFTALRGRAGCGAQGHARRRPLATRKHPTPYVTQLYVTACPQSSGAESRDGDLARVRTSCVADTAATSTSSATSRFAMVPCEERKRFTKLLYENLFRPDSFASGGQGQAVLPLPLPGLAPPGLQTSLNRDHGRHVVRVRGRRAVWVLRAGRLAGGPE